MTQRHARAAAAALPRALEDAASALRARHEARPQARAAALALFARPVVAGATKTRLAARLGADGAAALYAAFVTDTLATVRAVPELDATLWVAGDPHHPSLVGHALLRTRQPEGDLGARMAAALRQGLTEAPRALVLGTDTPTLPADHLSRALRLLDDHDVVLGPAADGGYYLIGAQRPATGLLPDLFSGVRWSSPRTLADTLDLTARTGLRVGLAPPWYDVDDAPDLALLRLHLSLDPRAAPATHQALAGLF
jgi:rSAM/selenodomain-associated transferase 1